MKERFEKLLAIFIGILIGSAIGLAMVAIIAEGIK